MSKKAVKGNKVKIHYTGMFTNGEIFDSSEQDLHHHEHGDSCSHHQETGEHCGANHHHHEPEPLEFELGSGMVIKGFDDAIMGMEVGETKKVTIPPEEAYGHKRDDMIIIFKMDQFPEGMNPQEGMMIELNNDQGGIIPAAIIKVEGEDVTIDANHQLAGETLVFALRLVEIEE